LPAALAILGPRVNAWSLPLGRWTDAGARHGLWHRVATMVMAHPWRGFLPVTPPLPLLGTPFLPLPLRPGDATAPPPWAEARRGHELLRREFPGADSSKIVVVLHYPDGSPLAPARVDRAWELGRWLARQPGVTEVMSAVDLPGLSREQSAQLAAA